MGASARSSLRSTASSNIIDSAAPGDKRIDNLGREIIGAARGRKWVSIRNLTEDFRVLLASLEGGEQVSVRKRTWATAKGERRESWVVAYSDAAGARRIATFERKRYADSYESAVKVQVRAGTHTAPSTSPTVAEAAAGWITSVELEAREATRRSCNTASMRGTSSIAIGSAKLANLTTPALNKFRDELLAALCHAPWRAK